MKILKTLLLSFMVLTTIITTSCAASINLDNHSVTKDLSGIAFQELDISSFFVVRFTQDNRYKVKVTVSERFEPYLISKIVNGKLTISFDTHGRGFKHTDKDKDTALVEISAPSFEKMDLSGAVTMTLAGNWKLDTASLDLSGASHLTGKDLKVNKLMIEQSGASHIEAALSVEKLVVDNSGASHLTLKRLNQKEGKIGFIDVSGASKVDLSEFPFEKMVIDASGASHVKAFPLKKLDAEASGVASIRYVDSSKGISKRLETSGCASISEN